MLHPKPPWLVAAVEDSAVAGVVVSVAVAVASVAVAIVVAVLEGLD